MLHIWGRITSLNVRKVVWAAQECGVPFQRTDAGRAFGIVQTDAYKALNPNALVPTLEDGELVLWESNVIVRYLLAKYGAPTLAAAPAALPPEGAPACLGRPGAAPDGPAELYPTELAARFDAERWMDWQQTTLNRAGGPAFMQWIRTAPEQRDLAAIAASVAATEPLLRQLDAHLQQQPFMAGQHFTMADIPIACEVHRWFHLPQPHPVLPALERWYQTVSTRPATRGVLDVPLA